MSVSAGDPTGHVFAAGTDDVLDEDSAEDSGEAALSLVDQALEGWELMAEAVAETDPGLAGLMASGALVARAAVEQELPSFIVQLGDYLAGTALTPVFREELIGELSRRISGPAGPFTLDWLAERHEQVVRSFIADRGASEMAPWHFLTAAASAAIRTTYGHDTPNLSSHQEWRIVATLEQPGKIGRGGSLFCAASSRRWRKNVSVEESSYQDLTYQSKPIGDVEKGEWVTLADSSGLGFARDFDTRETTGFAKTIQENPDAAAYLLQLDLGGSRAPLAKEFLEVHEQDILGLANTLIVPAKALVPQLALVPANVLQVVPKLLLGIIKKIIAKRLDDKILPSWVVYHTVLTPFGHAPTSVVLLRSLEQPKIAKATLVGTTYINGEMRETVDYQAFPVADLWPRGRIIDGATLPENPADRVPVEAPARIWEWVAENGRPLVWSDCWEQGQTPTHAFRVLVPFNRLSAERNRGHIPHRKRETQSYVAALRVEVYPVNVQPIKPGVYKI